MTLFIKVLKRIRIYNASVFLSVLMFLPFSSCKKDYVYEVNNVDVQQPGTEKSRVKTTVESISIAYSDLFNTTVPTDTLLSIQTAYDAFGDKKLIEDMIVRHFLNSSAIQIPSSTSMRADLPAFTERTIQKLFNRKADAMEKYFISNIISGDTSITPALVYYAMMTSDEYRYY